MQKRRSPAWLGALIAPACAFLIALQLSAFGAETQTSGRTDAPSRPQFIYVAGMVKFPNQYPFTNGMTVSSALKMAGGLTREASSSIVLKRGDKEVIKMDRKKLEQGKGKDIVIQPDDTVFVPKK